MNFTQVIDLYSKLLLSHSSITWNCLPIGILETINQTSKFLSRSPKWNDIHRVIKGAQRKYADRYAQSNHTQQNYKPHSYALLCVTAEYKLLKLIPKVKTETLEKIPARLFKSKLGDIIYQNTRKICDERQILRKFLNTRRFGCVAANQQRITYSRMKCVQSSI